jgi:hypothetical protein
MNEITKMQSGANQSELTKEGFAFDHVVLKKKLNQRNAEVEIIKSIHEQIDLFKVRKSSLAKYLFQKLEFSFSHDPRTLEESIHLIDKDYWHEFFEDINLIHLVSGDQLNEMRELVNADPSMAFTDEIVLNLIGNIWENRNIVFSQKIQSVLNNLSPNYKSNTGHSIAAKIVLPSSRGNTINWEICNALDDLRISARQILNQPVQIISSRTIIHHGKSIDDWIPVDCDNMRFKVFNNGNIHIWFSNELILRMNEILNLLQPNTLAKQTKKRKALSYMVEMKTQMFTNEEVQIYSKIIDSILRTGSSSYYDLDLATATKMTNSFHADVLNAELVKNKQALLKDSINFTLSPNQKSYFIMEMFLGGYEIK